MSLLNRKAKPMAVVEEFLKKIASYKNYLPLANLLNIRRLQLIIRGQANDGQVKDLAAMDLDLQRTEQVIKELTAFIELIKKVRNDPKYHGFG